ncbi:MAG TPA: hypothetical protein VEZ47_14070 [Gemmatirosa sp.]|nr:hypothetical protein [Gemmatirosa sp.]
MTRRPLPALQTAAATLLALLAQDARAQGGAIAPQCGGATVLVADACQKSVDLFNYFAPQLGALVAGGNTELGRGGTLGGPGHFSVGLRVNGMRSPVPQLQNVNISTSGFVRSQVSTEGTWVGFPVADAAIGIFKGIPLGVTNVGGIDLLVNAAYVPTLEEDDFEVRTAGSSFKVGYGARLGLLQETALVPGLAVSYLRRELPTTSVIASTQDGDRVGVTDVGVRTDSWRVAASKNLLFFGLAVGAGQDSYDMGATLTADVVTTGVPGTRAPLRDVRASQKLTRTNYFANLTLLNVPFFKLVGEIGRTQGGSLAPTYNDFDGRRPDQTYTYGSVGVRVGR